MSSDAQKLAGPAVEAICFILCVLRKIAFDSLSQVSTVRAENKRHWALPIFAMMLLCPAQGCTPYDPKQLTPESVEQALATDEHFVEVRAADLKHPMLRPLDVNLK